MSAYFTRAQQQLLRDQERSVSTGQLSRRDATVGEDGNTQVEKRPAVRDGRFEVPNRRLQDEGDCNLETLNLEVNSRSWRRMSVVELEGLVLALRRQAVHQHLTSSQWAFVDRLRSRVARLKREGGAP